ncbi:MAG: rRNA maturation RNase YbeY [Maricaulaceae bacterium]
MNAFDRAEDDLVHRLCEDWREIAPDPETWVRRTLDVARELHPAAGAAAIALADDAFVRALNWDHRGKDRPTNVLAFPASTEAAAQGELGDIVLAYETVAREACDIGLELHWRLVHLIIHGYLHLCGWDHQTEAEAVRMEQAEREVMARLGGPDPYPEVDALARELHG